MNIDRQEIHSSILNILEFLESGKRESATNIESLEFSLDKLALIYHFIGDVSDDENKHPESLIRDYSRWRDLLVKSFPNLGFGDVIAREHNIWAVRG